MAAAKALELASEPNFTSRSTLPRYRGGPDDPVMAWCSQQGDWEHLDTLRLASCGNPIVFTNCS